MHRSFLSDVKIYPGWEVPSQKFPTQISWATLGWISERGKCIYQPFKYSRDSNSYNNKPKVELSSITSIKPSSFLISYMTVPEDLSLYSAWWIVICASIIQHCNVLSCFGRGSWDLQETCAQCKGVVKSCGFAGLVGIASELVIKASRVPPKETGTGPYPLRRDWDGWSLSCSHLGIYANFALLFR